MKFLKLFFICAITTYCISSASYGAVSAECSQYSDCDMLVACELYTQVENALNGVAPDYNGAVANAASYRQACSNYPDLFARNINYTLSENPQVILNIDWQAVKDRMRYGSQGGFSQNDLQLVEMIVNFFGPDTIAQKNFFTDLATAYISANKSDETSRLDDAFVLNFLSLDDNLSKYKSALVDLTGDYVDEDLGINVSWDDILIAISEVLDESDKRIGALVCENNRSIQMTIDIVTWGATAVAAIVTFFTGGAGGAAVAAGRAAVGTGLKAAAKAAAKVGGKVAAKKLSAAGGKQLAKSAIKLGLKTNMRGYAKYAGKGVLKTGVKNYAKVLGANLKNKFVKYAGSGALLYQIGSSAAKNTSMTLYGLVESDLSNDIINCQGLDRNEGCYTVCGDNGSNDDLNTKVFIPELGKAYCVYEEDFALYEINPDGSRGKPLIMPVNKWNTIKSKIQNTVRDQGNCDWNEDDIDMYVGFYMYDPDTLEISNEALVIHDFIRIDE